MALFRRRKRPQSGSNVGHRTATVAFTARQPLRTVSERPPYGAERTPDAPSAHPAPMPSRTRVRVHAERLEAPSPRVDMTPSQALHLAREGHPSTR